MTWNTPKPGEWKSEELSKGRIIDYKAFNFVDGEGVRNSLYVSGCMFHCEGCYNVATWSFNAGIPYTAELEEQIMEDLAQPYVQGLTLLGENLFLIQVSSYLSLSEFERNCQTKTSGPGRATRGKK